MSRSIKLVIVTAVLVMAAALEGAPARAAEATLTRLPNGLGVLVQPDDRFPLVALRLYVHAGSAYETPEQSGISHLLEHMVFKGTGRRAPGEVAETIEGAGGYLNASTSFDYTVYTIDLPAERWTLGLDVLQDMIFNTALDPGELEREKKVVLAELERGEDDPSSRRFKTMQPLIWKGTGYERPIIGYRETVSGFGRDDILDYIHTYYQPQSMLMVVVGDVDPAKAVAQVQNFFGDLENHGRVEPAVPLPVPSFDAPRVRVEKGPWNKAYVSVAFPLPDMLSGAVPGLDLLGQLLGGDDTSRLYRSLKYDKGLVDDISAYAMTLERVGVLYISATLDGDKLPAFWEALNKELAGLDVSTFTDREIERARLNIEDSLYSSKETVGGLASKLGYFQFFEHSPRAEDNYLYALKHTGREELQKLADAYLTRNALAVSVLAPENGAAADELKKKLTATVDAAWTGARGAAQAKAAVGVRGQAETVDLGGGRTLVLLPDGTLPYTSVTMAFTGGDALLFPDEQGLAELASRALTRGAGSMGATEYEDYLSDRAAGISASAGRDQLVVAARFPSRFSADVLDVFRATVTEPGFAPEEVGRARDEQAASIHMREDRPTGKAFRHLFPMLFADSGYSYLHMGALEDVEKYGPDQVRGFWERQRRQPWVMAVCGDFDREAVTALARSLARGEVAEPFAYAAPEWGKEFRKNLELHDRNQSHVVVAFPVPGSRNGDSVGLDLLRQALAGQGGKLFLEMRDKQGLGYTVTAFLWQAPETGFLAFYIGTYPEKTGQAIEGFRKAVADLHAEPLSAQAVERARNLVEGDYYRDHQSLSSRAHEAAGLLVRGFDLDRNRRDIEKARTLSAEDLQRFAAKYLLWDKAYILTVTP